MTETGKEQILDLPVKIVFTENGVDWFIKHKKNLKRFQFADNSVEYGIMLKNYEVPLLQRMIHLSYISKIELSRIEFSSKRREIMDLTKMIIYDTLYKQFDTETFRVFVNSTLIKTWNRVNPSKVIDENSSFNEFYIESIMQKNRDKIQQIAEEISGPIISGIKQSKDLTNEEKQIQIHLIDHYFQYFQKLIWVFLSQFQTRMGYRTIINNIREIIKNYLEKSKIAEYVALILMELASNAENARFKEVAERIYPNNKNVETLIFSKKIREQVLSKLKKNEDYLYLTWKISGMSTSIGIKNKLQIFLFNEEYDYETIKKTIEDKTDIDLQGKNLIDFYEQIPDKKKNFELGLYYLSYLQDACKEQNIRFHSYVNQIRNTNRTVITLNLQF